MRHHAALSLAGVLMSTILLLAQPAQADTSTASTRPNIVIILADDMGYSDLGCYGSEISTPNLDQLARDGVRFTQAYNAARCCPSRAALLTGLYPHQAGMGDMVSTQKKVRPAGPYQGYLNEHCVTIAEALKSGGYQTFMAGKWHVGEKPEYWPRKRGFDRYFGLISGASSYFEILQTENPPRQMALDDTPYLPEGDHFYMTDAFTDAAVKDLEERDPQKPFLLYLAYTAPHWPLHALPEDIARYRGKYTLGWDELRAQRHARQLEMGILPPGTPLPPRDAEVPPWDSVDNKEDWDLRMAVYAAMITRMDQGIGRVLDTLHAIGVEDNTLVIFLADNGGCHEIVKKEHLIQPGAELGARGSYESYGRNWAYASNTPFRMYKHWCHEGGIATPFIARWSSHIPKKGALINEAIHITDILPTCLDLAGVAYPETFAGHAITPAVGKSLRPLLEGAPGPLHERLFWEHEGNRAVREGPWKLVATTKGSWELFNLDEDRAECNNLIGKYPEKAEAMNRDWEVWAKDVGVNLPKATPKD